MLLMIRLSSLMVLMMIVPTMAGTTTSSGDASLSDNSSGGMHPQNNHPKFLGLVLRMVVVSFMLPAWSAAGIQ